MMMSAMEAQSVVLGRFELESLAGSGGMGLVYRAKDLSSGMRVALKVMSNGLHTREMESDSARFDREVRLLAQLNHPAIVRYVTHGLTSRGEPVLVMEWLEGEDLGCHLARTSLTVEESLAMVERIASGLALAHERGIVHRDIKPTNLFLLNHDPAQVKLIDFGIARQSSDAGSSNALTGSGVFMGTLGYMAPEQATAAREAGASADIFALGTVLFECLTGHRAFAAPHAAMLLGKLLNQPAPRLADLRPDLDPALDRLVSAMLAKDPRARPADAAALHRKLAELGRLTGKRPNVPSRAVSLSAAEQRFVSIIRATPVPDERERLNRIVGPFGGELLQLGEGLMLVAVCAPGGAAEQAANAAGCALKLRDEFADARINVVMARATSQSPTLSANAAESVANDQVAISAWDSDVQLDPLTAQLIGGHFELEQRDGRNTLKAAGGGPSVPRTVLGKSTACVGRAKELALLEATLRESAEECVARAVIITGPAGQGKTRLAHEFVSLVNATANVQVLFARADPVAAGSAFLLARQLVRRAIGVQHADAPALIHAQVRRRVRSVCAESDSERIADFLCELLGSPTSAQATPTLVAARNDPQIMSEWLRRSFSEWLTGEAAAKPTLVVLEDVHWGDFPSVSFIGDVLKAPMPKSLLVLALGRPELRDTFPNLWSASEKQELVLGRLTPAAAEHLVRSAAPRALAPAVVSSIVARGDGNPFYLEELVRSAADGRTTELPSSVLALVESRLRRFPAEERRLMRAASIFGETFRASGVEALLGVEAGNARLAAILSGLVEHEVFDRVNGGYLQGDGEYVFRHSLLREAGYAMLTNADRVTGHRLAGDWLERSGVEDALAVANHFEKGKEPERAIRWLMTAQETAYGGGNIQSVIDLGARCIACGATDLQRGHVRLMEGLALSLRGDWARCATLRREAMSLLPVGSTRWSLAAGSVFVAGMFLGDASITTPVLKEILSVTVEVEPSGPYGFAVFTTCLGLVGIGQTAMARAFLDRAQRGSTEKQPLDPAFVLRLDIAGGLLDIAEEHLGRSLSRLQSARALAEGTGDAWGRASASAQYVAAIAETGDSEAAELAAKDVLGYCEQTGLVLFSGWAKLYLAAARRNVGQHASCAELVRGLLDFHDPFLVSNARALLANALIGQGDFDEAKTQALLSLEQGHLFPAVRAAASGALADIALRLGQAQAALEYVKEGLVAAEQSAWPRDKSILHLVHAEALAACGRGPEARTIIATAYERIHRNAARLDEPMLQNRYQLGIREHVRTRQLVDEWGVSEIARGDAAD